MKEELENMVNQGLSNIKIGEILNIDRRKISTLLKEYKIERIKIKYTNCKLCEKDLGENKRNRSRCSYCNTRIRRYRNKLSAVNMLGGECNRCGYNEHISALEFHHIDPNNKEFEIGDFINKSWDFIKEEIKKCELLCSNCHRVEHSKHDEKLIKESISYNGKKLDI